MNIPISDYLQIKAFSGGLAYTVLNDSAYQAWYQSPWNPDYKSDHGEAADIGTYAHAMLLEGEHAGLEVIQADDWRTKAAREARDIARADGRLPILAKHLGAVERMVERAKGYIEETELAGIFKGATVESTYTWTEAGVDCKIRPDLLSADRRIILSYKTTRSTANPRVWSRAQLPQCEIGMPLYERGIRSNTGTDQTRVVHLVQSQLAPYACSLVALDPARQDCAERALDEALSIWRRCLEEKRFPAYPTAIYYAEASAWQIAEAEQREVDQVMENGLGAGPEFDPEKMDMPL